MVRLSEAHIEQIKKLRSEGNTAPKIVEIMNATYPGVKFAPHHVYSVIKKEKKTARAGVVPKVKRQYKKHAVKAPSKVISGSVDIAQLAKDIGGLMAEIMELYGHLLKHFRGELLRSRAEVAQVLSGAGVDVPKSNIQ